MVNQIQIQKIRKKIAKDKFIEKEIKELKKELKTIQHDFQKKVYFILRRIMELRKTQIKGYGMGGLSRERDINMTIHQIMYIFGYEYISEYTMHKINTNQLRLSTALYIIRQDVRYREPKYQDKAVSMYLNGKLKTTEISRLSTEILFDNVVQDREIDIANKQLINISFSIQEMMKTIRSKRNLFSDKKTTRYLINQVHRFKNLLEESLKYGEKFINKKNA